MLIDLLGKARRLLWHLISSQDTNEPSATTAMYFPRSKNCIVPFRVGSLLSDYVSGFCSKKTGRSFVDVAQKEEQIPPAHLRGHTKSQPGLNQIGEILCLYLALRFAAAYRLENENRSRIFDPHIRMKSWFAFLTLLLCSRFAFAQSGQIEQVGLLADYRFAEGSGAVVADSSGNNNDGIFCASAPIWNSPGPGLSFDSSGTQCVQLPSTLNGAQTIQVLIHFQGTANSSFPLRAIVGSNSEGPPGHDVAIVAVESDYLRATGSFYLGELGGPSGQSINHYFGYLNGAVMITLVLTGNSRDAMYINETQLGLAMPGFSSLGGTRIGHYFLGATGDAIAARAPTKGAQMKIFRALFYSGRLSASQIEENVKSAELLLAKQGALPNGQCCDISSSESDTEDFAGLIGDSIATGAEPTFWKDMVLDGPAGWTKSDMGINGSTSASCLASGEWCAGPMYRPKAKRNLIVFFAGGNDIDSGVSPNDAFQATVGTIRLAKAKGFTVFMTTLLPRNRNGFDKKRDEFNAFARGQWKQVADGLVDLASDPQTGADAKASVKELFPDGVHPSAATNYNNMSPYFQRRINRFYGAHDWAGAAKYYRGAQEAVSATGCSESANIVTVASTLWPPVGSTVRWSGAEPDEYNSKSAGWWVLTTRPDHFTFYHPKAGLGACSTPGRVSVALQKDADGWQVLDFGTGEYTLESCIGLTGEPIHIRNVNAKASTIVPWGSEKIDGKPTITIRPRTTIVLMPVFLGPETAACTWMRVP